jgi:hypothetical protein
MLFQLLTALLEESTLSWHVQGGSVLVLGAFLGYILGFISHARSLGPQVILLL